MIAKDHARLEEKPWRSPADWYRLILLLCIVALAWCAAYNRWTAQAWQTPVAYGGDALPEMAMAKALGSGEIAPIWPRFPASLGAPFRANWNDYPRIEQGIFAWYGLIVRIFGVFVGSNLTLLSAHCFAAASFYFVARLLEYRPAFSLAGAFLFSMSHFAFARSLSHLVLTFYWHVPLGLLVVWWCGASTPILNDWKKLLLCVAISVLHGIQNPYYTGMFVQFLVLTSLVCLIRREKWSKVILPLFLASIVVAVFVVMDSGTLYYQLVNGPNAQAVSRNYEGLEQYALKPVELLLPFPHRITSLQTWAHKAYFARALFLGESGSPYLGIVGIVALGALVWFTVRALVSYPRESVPSYFWLILWIFVYSVVGGANGFFGLFGLVLFRGTNRYSIVILALVLLFLVRKLTLFTRKWHWSLVWAIAGILSVIGFLDQSGRPPEQGDIARIHDQVLSDGQIVSAMEAELTPGAMVFELPICDFPEMPPLREMTDYEHFRPYLQSLSLRFSYGSDKGRMRERWQPEAMQFGVARCVAILENYGFSAVLLNKKAYDDHAASILADFRSAGRSEVLAESSDLVCILLRPSIHPTLPPEFDQHWYGIEGNAKENWRWSQGDATLVLYNSETVTKQAHLSFALSTLKSRLVEIFAGPEKLYDAFIAPDQPPKPVAFTVALSPGRNAIHFRTDVPGELPGNGDARKLAFNVRDFTVLE